ncbi:antibiotic biosynthesis monooxygenase [Microbacterium sp. cx-55]|uniref:putative quinol monooxygenase n=1 Tax=Microbacterium sp. cx-55 TaxID=2875948 RepID=UPI001CBFC1F3|nr:antibiotic biosynthesis monooxygenase [Microbacterium sp. cx-55]MBZ4487146.1 antibiotic biosynthesis monooxygenase [Microbacterium sp. cx-55]UGB35178.1 antibiotic biosynthesis monooxygenase [Microbacterium sp. cx-55]
MIIRVSEAHVAPDHIEEFLEQLHALVADFPTRYDGLVSHEILTDMGDPGRIQYVSRWTDQIALIAYAGEAWAHDPVTFPDEDRYLTTPLTLRHFAITTI